jgi:acyl-coenzyme A synthetase/AMP-(fatty) acid ligase
VEVVESLPKTATGKVLKKELRKLYGQAMAQAPAEAIK